MIDLKDVKPSDILPEALRKDPKIEAAGYALGKTARMILGMIDTTAVYAAVDILPEELVDLLAMEFRAQYYDKGAPLQKRREAVKKALPWYEKAGTVSVVRELCELLYGESKVREWFVYGGKPYTFRVEIFDDGKTINLTDFNNFIRAIQNVKNTRSHLEALVFHRKTEIGLHSGVAATSYMRQPIVDFFVKSLENETEGGAAAMAAQVFTRCPITDFEKTEMHFVQDDMSGAASVTSRTQIIMEG